MDMRIPPLKIKILLESNPLKSIIIIITTCVLLLLLIIIVLLIIIIMIIARTRGAGARRPASRARW